MKKNILIILITIVMVSAGTLISFAEINKIVAKVNNDIITSDDLQKYVQMLAARRGDPAVDLNQDELRKEALNRLIEDRLILQQAKKEDIEVPSTWLENKIKQLIARHPSQEAFYDSLQKQGITMSYLKKRLSQQYLLKEVIDKEVRAKIAIAPGEINQFYQENQADFQSPSKVSFFIAKDSDREKIENMKNFIEKEGIEKGKENYKNVLSNIESYINQLQKPLAEALTKLKDKELTITKINKLYYLVYREKMESPRELTLSEVQDQVYEYLWQQQFSQEFNSWVDALKEKAVIKNYSSPDLLN